MARGLIKTLGLAGAALTAWYFLDPKKGSERRDNFMKSAKDIYDTAGEELGRLGKDISGGLSDTLTKVTEMTGKVTEMAGMAKGGQEEGADGNAKSLSAKGAKEPAAKQTEPVTA